MQTLNPNKWQRIIAVALLFLLALVVSASISVRPALAQDDDPYVEIINETDTTLCAFGAVPAGESEVAAEHIFAEVELEPGDDFWDYYDLVGTFTLVAADCEDYTIVEVAENVELGQVGVIWYVGDSVEYDGEVVAQDSASSGGSTSSESTTPSGDAADSGFRPEDNGFSFENYGNDSVSANLTAAELQRMFGDMVCASLSGGECILTPPAQRWMTEINNYMDGGHCEGMAVLSMLMYDQIIEAAQFGGDTAHDLSLADEALQREIAYWWTTQATLPASSIKLDESPSAILDVLIQTFNEGANAAEKWVMGIYMADFSGGHAITPYAVEDQGGGIFHVLVYDNNWPDMGRVLVIDKNGNSWSYQASTNPNEPESLYEGDASTGTLEIVGITSRLEQQYCEFCAGDGNASLGRGRGLAAPAQEFNQIWLNGQADLLITTAEGKRIGFVDGEFVNEIEGARGDNMKFGVDIWDINNEPVYFIPLGIEFTITVDASRAAEGITSDVTMIGPGYNLVVADLYLDPGAKDVITISPDGKRLAYSTEYNDAPDMIFGIETPAADYEFIVAALDIESGAEFIVELDIENGTLSINTDNTTEYGTYEIVMYRIDDDGEAWFNNNDIYMEPGDTAFLKFLEWEGPGTSMFIDIDYGSDGSIDETIELVDEYVAE
ncbi:MAG: hypothetical protein HN413_07000 [Chloroflexi bacterium]|jgi:hypothetical protein|nr:hypothetical protein [Chloroflexota bacterium]